ncbi:hypothetical protein [Actinomadura mexicana]|uniref:hypothetical protein n=1 Tax=Actinomadura mexicana TaxID=134959 RepID=UPI000B77FCC5|nr:hypothetical protein [Actinomadura mexicana]
MSIAGAWYSSGTFWTATGVVVTLLVGLGTGAVTYLTRFARQRLDYGLRTVAPLLTAPDGVRDDLELRHRGVKLERPYLTEVVLAGRGRRDIPRSAFDNGAPIRLNLGAAIVELLQVKTTDSASSTPPPPVATDAEALLIGPGLIGRRQRITLSVLVEGEPDLSCEAPLPNARVRSRSVDPIDPVDRAADLLRLTLAAGLLIFLMVTGASWLLHRLSG